MKKTLPKRKMIRYCLSDTAVHMGTQHQTVCFFQDGLGSHQLGRHIQTVAVLLHHLQNPVDLSPGCFEQPADLFMIRFHCTLTT